MFFGTLKDGGEFFISNDTIMRWKSMYPNVAVLDVILALYKDEAFNKLSKRAALKLINKTLKEKSNQKL